MKKGGRMVQHSARVTMVDVANEAGVSQSTVSFVLNDVRNVRISETTRQRVMEAATALGYLSPGHRAIGNRVSRIIGFVVDDIATSPFGVASMDGARQLAWEHDRVLMIMSTGSDSELEKAVLKRLLSLQPEGIIYASILTRQVEVSESLDTVPTVLLNCYTADKRFPSVIPAEVAGGHTAASHLIAAGHSRIGFINGETWMDAARDRLKGYRRALASADLPFDSELVKEGNWLPSEAYAQTRNLMALEQPPTAIFCANDAMAVGCYEALRDLGKRIPEDVSVMGYDNQWVAGHLSPPLTTVTLPHEEMGRWAIEYLIDRIFSPNLKAVSQVKLECPLIERASVQTPKP